MMRSPDNKADSRNKVLVCRTASSVSAILFADDGMLLHKISWPKNVPYKVFCQQYAQTVLRVFDGYSRSTAKDHTHIERSYMKSTADTESDESMVVSVQKNNFYQTETISQDL